jgi:hypothetical protein
LCFGLFILGFCISPKKKKKKKKKKREKKNHELTKMVPGSVWQWLYGSDLGVVG